MEQRDMEWYQFLQIVRAVLRVNDPERTTVQLQGEGEPSLHPHFWSMVRFLKAWGFKVTTITNGTTLDSRFTVFDEVSVSLDTLDTAEANRIGRFNVRKVANNLEEFVKANGPDKLRIVTVNYGQGMRHFEALGVFVQHILKARWALQRIQAKDDYASNYPQHSVVRRMIKPGTPVKCAFVTSDWMRFYSIDGKVLPCCFIKDSAGIDNIDGLRADLDAGNPPFGCRNCEYLHAKEAS